MFDALLTISRDLQALLQWEPDPWILLSLCLCALLLLLLRNARLHRLLRGELQRNELSLEELRTQRTSSRWISSIPSTLGVTTGAFLSISRT